MRERMKTEPDGKLELKIFGGGTLETAEYTLHATHRAADDFDPWIDGKMSYDVAPSPPKPHSSHDTRNVAVPCGTIASLCHDQKVDLVMPFAFLTLAGKKTRYHSFLPKAPQKKAYF